MPPVTKAGGPQFRKDVEFVTKDDDEQVAAGVVMVPDKADLQNDFAREETIRGFADQFGTFVEGGQAGGGVMHAVFPDDWMDLDRNEVLDEPEEIGGKEVPSGAWVQEWGINNDAQWGLITDGILSGYSIGAIQVDWAGPYEQDEVDDVEVPEELGDDVIWELTDGIIREVSTVDIPAVPDAQILEAKAMEKRLADHLGNREAFIDEAKERGHSEDDAQRLWDVLNTAVEAEGSADPGTQSVWSKAGKAFFKALSGSDDDEAATPSEAPDADGGSGSAKEGYPQKEGRTLSRQNRESLYATIDASLDVLHDAGVEHGMTRFTDREDTAFDLSEHSAREWTDGEDEDEEDPDEEEDASPLTNDAGGDTPDDDGSDHEAGADPDDDETDSTDMSENTDADDPMEEAPEWAQTLHEDITENSKRLDEQADQIESALDDEEEKTVEIEVGGEMYEVSESEAKAWFDEDSDPFDDAPAWAKALKERVEANSERVDTISRQSGRSQQLDAAAGDDDDDDSEKGALGGLGEALS